MQYNRELMQPSAITFLILCLSQFICNVWAAPGDPLKLHADKEEEEIIALDESGHHHGISLFKFQWDHVSAPLTIAFWFFTVTLAKIVFHRFQRVHSLLPDSALLIVLGLIFGYIFDVIYPNEKMYLKPDWFFLYLLPPIALDAGYFLPNKDFFRNFGTIMTYAVFGTLWNASAIGTTLFFIRGYFTVETSLIELLLFSTLISAVDPVAVLCVFEEIHVNQLLYICVFGESLLNDAVTIVLYQTFNAMVDATELKAIDYITASSSFFVVSIGGLLIGILWAVFTGYTTKHSRHLNVVQPLICLLFPYMSYLNAELVAMSGILAIVMCGLMMKQFVVGNLSRKSLVTVQYFMKTLSSSCEALIFVYLGISAVSKDHVWDLLFISVTLICCLVYRFIGVYFLTYLLNSRRVQKINLVDQFIMSYGGIRGAVCYGLVMSLDGNNIKAKDMFASCTIVVIMFTVFVQGGTIKQLVKLLKVKHNEVHSKTVFEMVGENIINNMMTGVEGITGHRGQYWFRQTFNKFSENYVKPYLMSNAKSGVDRLMDYHEHIQVKEAVQHLKVHGSFAGLTTTQSKVNLEAAANDNTHLTVDDSAYTGIEMIGSGMERSNEMSEKIPRNESISVFLQGKLNELNSPVSTGMYSRHLLDVDNTPRASYRRHDGQCSNSFDALETDTYHMTYPYCKNTQVRRQKVCGLSQTDRLDMAPNKSVTLVRKDSASEPLTFLADSSSKPRFVIISESETSPPNAPRYAKRKSAETDLQERIEEGGASKAFSNLILPGEISGKSQSDGVRKSLSGTKTWLAKEGGEKSTLSPVREDDESADIFARRSSSSK